jgi:hypothetical protein
MAACNGLKSNCEGQVDICFLTYDRNRHPYMCTNDNNCKAFVYHFNSCPVAIRNLLSADWFQESMVFRIGWFSNDSYEHVTTIKEVPIGIVNLINTCLCDSNFKVCRYHWKNNLNDIVKCFTQVMKIVIENERITESSDLYDIKSFFIELLTNKFSIKKLLLKHYFNLSK